MVCHGPDPPEHSPQELTPPPVYELAAAAGNDSDDEPGDYVGYEPLPQGPDGFLRADTAASDDDEDSVEYGAPPGDVPAIEPIEQTLCREVWSTPRTSDPIHMDKEKADQVMSAMANFVLPQTSIPEWARCLPEDQWKDTLNDRIDRLRQNT